MAYEGNQDALAAAALASGDGVATTRASRFVAVLVQYSKKAPAQVIELALDGLNPLALRALSNLPRAGTHQVVRPITKDDGRGFTFTFKVDASELTPSGLPALLERWDGKYETARLKAFPPAPEEKVVELRPRNPFARKSAAGAGDDDDDENGSSRARETFVENLSVVNAAIATYDAQVMGRAIHVGTADEQEDPVLSAQVHTGEPAAADHAPEQAALDLGLGAGGSQGNPLDLVPLYIEVPGQDSAAGDAPGVVDAAGQRWHSWVALSFEVSGPGVFALKPRNVDVAQLTMSGEQRTQAAAIQRAVGERAKAAAESLMQALRAKTLAMTAAARRNLGNAVLSDAAGVLEMLEDLLLQMQLSAGAEQRLNLHALGMPLWAIDVREALAAGADCYGAYLAATGPVEALEVVDRWCAPMLPLKLTEQMGLFADPAAIRLQTQLQRLVDLAKRWAGPVRRRSTRDECARVLAVWIDMVRAGSTPVPTPEKKVKQNRRDALLIGTRASAE